MISQVPQPQLDAWADYCFYFRLHLFCDEFNKYVQILSQTRYKRCRDQNGRLDDH